LRIVDAIHRDKNIDKEIVFEGIEAALVSAAKKHYGEEADIVVKIDREDGSIHATHEGRVLDSEETVGRIGAQTAKQVMIQKIREIADGVIQIRAMAREPGYRSKVAVSSSDPRVDCVGACVGVRGNRIKNIVDELAGERIDIVRWDENLEVLIPNALQPAEVEQVILCKMLGRGIVLVREDQLSLA